MQVMSVQAATKYPALRFMLWNEFSFITADVNQIMFPLADIVIERVLGGINEWPKIKLSTNGLFLLFSLQENHGILMK